MGERRRDVAYRAKRTALWQEANQEKASAFLAGRLPIIETILEQNSHMPEVIFAFEMAGEVEDAPEDVDAPKYPMGGYLVEVRLSEQDIQLRAYVDPQVFEHDPATVIGLSPTICEQTGLEKGTVVTRDGMHEDDFDELSPNELPPFFKVYFYISDSALATLV